MRAAIFVPTRGMIWHETASRLTQIGLEAGLGLPTYYRNTTGVADARNVIVQAFLQTDADVLVMCDDDVVPPEHGMQILEDVEAGEADVVAGICPIMRPGTIFMPNVFERIKGDYRINFSKFTSTGLQIVDAVGTGFIAIHRRVLNDMQKMGKPAFVYKDNLGEDVNFCKWARMRSWKVAADFDVWCEHVCTVHANATAQSYLELIQANIPQEQE